MQTTHQHTPTVHIHRSIRVYSVTCVCLLLFEGYGMLCVVDQLQRYTARVVGGEGHNVGRPCHLNLNHESWWRNLHTHTHTLIDYNI